MDLTRTTANRESRRTGLGRHRVALMFALFLAAFGLRVLATHHLGGLDRPVEGDEMSYVPLAESLAAGKGFANPDGSPHTARLPAIPFLVSLVYRATGPSIVAARVFMCLLGALVVPVCYLLARELDGDAAGVCAALAAAVMPNWVYLSGAILTDLLSAVFTCLMIWGLVAGRTRQSRTMLCLGGFAWGLSALVRASSLAFAPAVGLWAFVSGRTWRERFAGVLLPAVVAALTIAPWSIRNARVFGRPAGLSSQGGMTLWCGNNPAAGGILYFDFLYYQAHVDAEFPPEAYPDALARSEACKARAKKFILENPRRFCELAVIRLYELWKIHSPRVRFVENLAMILSFGPMFLFFAVQVLRRVWSGGGEFLILGVVGCQTAVHMVFTSIVRYRMPIEPLVLAVAVAGFLWSIRVLRRRTGGSRHLTSLASTPV